MPKAVSDSSPMLRDLQRSTRPAGRSSTDNPFANIGCTGSKGSLTLHQIVRSQRFWLRPALPKALLPRDRKPAPEPVRHFNRAKRESDARNKSSTAPENSTAPAHGEIQTPPFRPFSLTRRHEPIPEGDQDDPGDNQPTLAAAQRAQPKPHHTSTIAAPALRYRSQPDSKIRAIGLRAGEDCF